MASKIKRQEITELFIEIWREERSLWDVKSPIYKDRNAKLKSFNIFKEKLGMEGMNHIDVANFILAGTGSRNFVDCF